MPDLVCKGWNIHFRDQVPVPDDQHAVDVPILVLNLLQHGQDRRRVDPLFLRCRGAPFGVGPIDFPISGRSNRHSRASGEETDQEETRKDTSMRFIRHALPCTALGSAWIFYFF